MRIEAGRLRARVVGAEGAAPAFAMRAALFRDGAPDRDGFDADARHLLIEDRDGLRGCARVWAMQGRAIARGYSGQVYGLDRFADRYGRALEVGRVCLAPGASDPDVPRLMLAMLARMTEDADARAIFGCTSFPIGAAPLGRLADRTAPADWAPEPVAAERVPLAGTDGVLPPLMRAWLSMGARVSDHAVIDRDLGTVHVLTALPVDAIPPARARLLAALPAAAD